jgi:hypothetical protein
VEIINARKSPRLFSCSAAKRAYRRVGSHTCTPPLKCHRNHDLTTFPRCVFRTTRISGMKRKRSTNSRFPPPPSRSFAAALRRTTRTPIFVHPFMWSRQLLKLLEIPDATEPPLIDLSLFPAQQEWLDRVQAARNADGVRGHRFKKLLKEAHSLSEPKTREETFFLFNRKPIKLPVGEIFYFRQHSIIAYTSSREIKRQRERWERLKSRVFGLRRDKTDPASSDTLKPYNAAVLIAMLQQQQKKSPNLDRYTVCSHTVPSPST